MAKHVLYNASVVVNGVDLSDHVESVEWVDEINGQAAAAMGEVQDYEMPGTLVVSPIQVTFYQDFAASKVYATLHPLWAARTTFNIVIKNDAGATAATNPAHTCPVFIGREPVISGQRGQRHMAPVTFKPAGLMTTATS
jgi:hypothetical protein